MPVFISKKAWQEYVRKWFQTPKYCQPSCHTCLCFCIFLNWLYFSFEKWNYFPLCMCVCVCVCFCVCVSVHVGGGGESCYLYNCRSYTDWQCHLNTMYTTLYCGNWSFLKIDCNKYWEMPQLTDWWKYRKELKL